MVDPVSAAIGIGGSLLSGILGGGAARRAKRKAQQEARRLKRKLVTSRTCFLFWKKSLK